MSSRSSQVLNHPRLPGKTVYILGAGFSKPLGLPLISDFISEGLNLLKQNAWDATDLLESSKKRAAYDFKKADRHLLNRMQRLLERRLPMLRAVGGDEPSIEDVFCAVDLLRHRNNGNRKSAPDDRQVLEEFVSRVCDLGVTRHLTALSKINSGLVEQQYAPLISHVHFKNTAIKQRDMPIKDRQHQRVCPYSAFLSQVFERAAHARQAAPKTVWEYATPAIISLNYDLVIETKSRDFSGDLLINYGKDVLSDEAKKYCGRNKELFRWLDWKGSESSARRKLALPLLKLHGSINWAERIPLSGKEAQERRTPTSVWIKRHDELATPSPLIFPTWQRDPLAHTVFNKVLEEARIHLHLASRIVVIGYSMPPTDRYIRYLLADALHTPEQPVVEVCNGWDEETCRKKVRSMFGERAASAGPRNYPGGFLEYVSSEREKQLIV